LETEKELLTACLKEGGASFTKEDVIREVTATLEPDYFVHDHFKKIYAGLQVAVAEAGMNEVQWSDVRQHIHPESVARQTLHDMVTDVKLPPITKSWVERSIRTLGDMYKCRRILQAQKDVELAALNGEADRAFDDLMEAVFALGRDRFHTGAQPWDYYIDEIHKNISERRNNKGIVGLETGLAPFDKVFGGLQKSHLYYLGGRPGMRKSVVCGQVAWKVVNDGKRVLLASPEMSAEQYTMRLACYMTGLDFDQYNLGKYTEDEERQLHDVVDIYRHKNLIINQSGEQGTHSLRQDIIRFRPDLVILDYSQLFSPSRPKFSEYTDLSMLSKELNTLKKDFKIPILAAVQLSRKVEEREDKRPIKSDIRSTGQFEQDADGIFMLYSDREYADHEEGTNIWRIGDREIDPETLEFVCAKNRNGSTRDVTCYVREGEMFIQNERTW
jgi:replicative DNA helicase